MAKARKRGAQLLLAALALLAGGSLACHRGVRQPRRLVLVTLDTLRADHLGAYGYARPTSPGLNAFAATATLFSNVTCSMPTTLPSHLTLFTGLRPAQHGVRRNGVPPATDLTSIFELLAERGLEARGFVATRLLGQSLLPSLGIEISVGAGERGARALDLPASAVTDAAVDWLDRRDDSGFALWVHYFDAHEPYSPPPAARSRFAAEDPDLPSSLSVEWLVGLNDPARDAALSPAERRNVVDLYDAEIASLDAAVARLFDALRQRGLWDDALVVVVGDHGQAHGESQFWGHGERLLEPVIRIPLLVKLPGQTAGRVVGTPVESVDLVPTILELFGLPARRDLGGRSLASALRGGAAPAPRPRLVERRDYPDAPDRRGVALDAGDWKVVFYRGGDGSESWHLGRSTGSGGLDGQELFQPEAEEVRDLRRLLPALVERQVDEGAGVDAEALRTLGYLD